MIEVFGNLWAYPAHARCITTNGYVRRDGCAVMGRGCAWEAARRYPKLAKYYGTRLKKEGNHVMILMRSPLLLAFPVKHHWSEPADLALIEQSAVQLQAVFELAGKMIVLPRPGCGNGQRDWDREVKPLIASILDDRFHVITFASLSQKRVLRPRWQDV